MIVMKFGGTSVGDEAAVLRLVTILKGRLARKPLLVVSAISQATNILEKVAKFAADGFLAEALALLGDLKERHLRMLENLLLQYGADFGLSALDVARDGINVLCDELAAFVTAKHSKAGTAKAQAQIVSYGELLSTTLLSAVLEHFGIKNVWLDAREFIITDDNYLSGNPNLVMIKERVNKIVAPYTRAGQLVLTQGFIARTLQGEAATLGREGSDCTATLLGMALAAKEVEIWTDVDGMMTADPRYIKNSRVIDMLSFQEAEAMAYFGAKVLHPRTIEPARLAGIPVRVLNSKNSAHPGTLILERAADSGAKAVAVKFGLSKITLPGSQRIDDHFLQELKLGFLLHEVSANEEQIVLESKALTADLRAFLAQFGELQVEEDVALVSLIGRLPQDLQKVLGPHRLAPAFDPTYGLSFLTSVSEALLLAAKLHDKFCL